MGDGLRVVPVTSRAGLLALREAWDALLAARGNPSPFLTWEWIWHWWNCMGEEEELAILQARRDEALVGVAPFVVSGDGGPLARRTLRFAGGEITDALDLLLRTPDPQVVDALLSAAHARFRWRLMDLRHLPEGSGSVAPIRRWTELVCGRPCVARYAPGLAVPLPSTPEAYWTSLSRGMRRKLRKAEEAIRGAGPPSFTVISDPREVREAVEVYLSIHRERWASHPENLHQHDGYGRFLRDVAIALSAKDITRLYRLQAADDDLVLCLGFERGGSTVAYGIAVKPEARAMDAGFYLLHQLIVTAIQRGGHTVDLLRGDADYKLRLGARPQWRVSLRAVAPGVLSRLAAVVGS